MRLFLADGLHHVRPRKKSVISRLVCFVENVKNKDLHGTRGVQNVSHLMHNCHIELSLIRLYLSLGSN